MIYIYLLGRDRRDLKIITTLTGSCPVKRITNIKTLQLPVSLEKTIEAVIHDNRMKYEAWIESADSVQDLIVSLKNRGHKKFPMTHNNLLKEQHNTALDPIVAKRMKIN